MTKQLNSQMAALLVIAMFFSSILPAFGIGAQQANAEQLEWKFDFGTASSPVLDGYVGVHDSLLYSEERGYGLSTTTASRYRGGTGEDDMAADFVLGLDYAFIVDIPNGEYDVTVYSGDLLAGTSTTNTRTTIDGVLMGTISTRQAVANATYRTEVKTGQLRLDFSGSGVGGYVNGVVIRKVVPMPPAVPQALTVAAVSSSNVTLQWTGSEDAASYNVHRSEGGDAYTTVATVTDAVYTDFSVTVGSSYSYRVSAVGENGLESDPSEPVIAVVAAPTAPPAAPANLTVKEVEAASVQLSWLPVEEAEGYAIFRSASPEGEFAEIGTTSGTGYTDTSADTSAVQYYFVKAFNEVGLSEASNMASSPVYYPAEPLPAEPPYRFDFGSGELEDGYLRVAASTAYTAERKYGFADPSKVGSGNRNTGDPLRTDFVLPGETSFIVDLPNGDYSVTVISGDAQEPVEIGVVAETIQKIQTTNAASGEYIEQTFEIALVDGQLNLEFTGSSPKINGLVITKLPDRAAGDLPAVYIAGDSTVQTYDEYWKPEAGWGQMIPRFFNTDITFNNHAIGGRSSKSFIFEGRLDAILRAIKPGDYFLVQFGHNDATISRPERYASVPDYKNYLKTYVNGARQRGATPILVTPVGRRSFNPDTGKFNVSFPEYVQGMKEVAEELNVDLVDLSALSVAYYDSIGPEGTLAVFLHTEPGIYQAFPNGSQDNTHFQEYGAIQIARLVSGAITELGLPLSAYVTDIEPPANVPDKPAGAAASNISNAGALLTWNAAEGADIYKVYRKLASDDNYALVGTATIPQISLTGMSDGQTYHVVVSAVNGKGESELSDVVVIKTKEATLKFDFGLAGSPIAEGYTEVNLSTLYTPERGYGIVDSTGMIGRDRGTGGDLLRDWLGYFNVGWSFNVDVPNGLYAVKVYVGDFLGSARTTVEIEGVDYGQVSAPSSGYTEKVIPVVSVQDGQMNFRFAGSTGIVNGLEITPLLASPSNLKVDELSLDPDQPFVAISWDAVDEAVKYNVYRRTSGTSQIQQVGSVIETAFTDNSVDVGMQYVYTVTTVDAAGTESEPSMPLTAALTDPDQHVPDTPGVVLTDHGGHITLQNSKVFIEIGKSGAHIRDIRYAGDNRNLIGNTSGGYSFQNFFDGQSGRGWWVGNMAYRLVEQTDSMVTVSFSVDNPEVFPFVLEYYMTFLEDDPGIYIYTVFRAEEWMPEGASIGQSRYAMRVDPNIFTYYAVDDARMGEVGEGTPTIESMQDATDMQDDGQIYTKYQKISNLEGDHHVHGLYGEDIGISFIQPRKEHFVGGPTKQELTLHRGGPIILWHEHAGHYGSPGPQPYRGWEKIYGPLYVYINEGDGLHDMWEDAKQRAQEEIAKWPYQWLNDPLYQANERIDVSGQLNITDGSSPENAWVILGPQGIDWQLQNLDYLYYIRADENGNFTIPSVRPGTYTFTAFVDGVLGEFKIEDIVVQGQGTIDLGTLDWIPPRYGEQLWQIGTPNRSAEEFFISEGIARSPVTTDRFREFGTWLYYPLQFPDGVDFKIGESDWATDWNYFHPMRRTPGDPNHFHYAGDYTLNNSPETWKIRFDSEGSLAGTGRLTVGLASSVYGSLSVKLNGEVIADYESIPGPLIDNALYRHAIRGIYRQLDIPFDASLIQDGENIIELAPSQVIIDNFWVNMYANVMYDVLRMEVDQNLPFGEIDVVQAPELVVLTLGDTYQIEPVAMNTSGEVMDNISFVYSSSHPNIASVDIDGRVTVHDWGSSIITVSTLGAVNNKSAEVRIMVATDPVDQIAVDVPNVIRFGESVQLAPVGLDLAGNPVANVVFAYDSSDSEVVQANASGVVTGLKTGTATITIRTTNTVEEIAYSFAVEVVAGPLNAVNEVSLPQLQAALEDPDLGLSLVYYHKLTAQQKEGVVTGVYYNREQNGQYMNVAELQQVLNQYVLKSGYYSITTGDLLGETERIIGQTPIQSTINITEWIQQEHLGDQTASFYFQMIVQNVRNARIDGRDHPDENRRPKLRLVVDGQEVLLSPTGLVSFNSDGGYRRETPFTVTLDYMDTYMKFDLSGISGGIESAELMITTWGRTELTDEVIGVYAMEADNWFSNSSFNWNSRPSLTQALSIDHITLDAPDAILPGDIIQLLPEGRNASGNIVPNVRFSFESSDSGIVEVYQSGLVRAISPGQSTITIRSLNTEHETVYVYHLEVNDSEAAMSFDDLAALTAAYLAETGAPGSEGVANSLNRKLANAKAKAAEGNGREARNLLQAYMNEVRAQSGKKLTEEQAAELVRWAGWLQDAMQPAGGDPE